ncbi:M20/M25/M40 family metallo-hydrolase [Bhargavaea cecembensis]|uniref:M20/M25/M40 family metallo-hydrolase n=1 Tax=Bhargavaea cecembensis TaxID=394098 RepID=UPI00058F0A3D|nr:M20/M25/M40 family metallo-hydrolase [Bhargavaea cecembensis]
MGRRWDTPEARRALLCELVSWDSRTLTEGERLFAHRLETKLREMDHFRQHPDRVALHDVDYGRHTVTALYKHPEAADTIVLISHFDTVQTEEYGALQALSTLPEELTAKLHEVKDALHEEARADLESGEYLFGRGTMDMKAGLAAHMALIEQAADENWPVNLLLLTVPDEEVNSAGMRVAVEVMLGLAEAHDLSYSLFLNGEPSFTQEPGDEKEYIYSGTIGKIMPAALFYGKETHVGEPFQGLTANYIASFLTRRMEFCDLFEETEFGETTPLPVSLYQRDLKDRYSTQTPYRAAALYNVFLYRRTAADVMETFERVARDSAAECSSEYREICRRQGVRGIGDVQVYRYEQIVAHAEDKLGPETVRRLKEEAIAGAGTDERAQSFAVADLLMIECQELSPAIVLLYAPPYYPAINSSDEKLVRDAVALMKETADALGTKLGQIHYFNGICDLSYVNYKDDGNGWIVYERNTPVWGDTYSIPFEGMRKLSAPVLNLGPLGRDAHQRTERLHMDSAFRRLPAMLETLIRKLFIEK